MESVIKAPFLAMAEGLPDAAVRPAPKDRREMERRGVERNRGWRSGRQGAGPKEEEGRRGRRPSERTSEPIIFFLYELFFSLGIFSGPSLGSLSTFYSAPSFSESKKEGRGKEGRVCSKKDISIGVQWPSDAQRYAASARHMRPRVTHIHGWNWSGLLQGAPG